MKLFYDPFGEYEDPYISTYDLPRTGVSRVVKCESYGFFRRILSSLR